MSTPTPTPDFLPPTPPSNSHCHLLDFATTTPPLPEYSRYLAAIIDNALTPSECTELLHLAEASTPDNSWDRATINVGNGRQALSTDSRNCGRIVLDSRDLADKLYARLLPFLQELGIDRLDDRPSVTRLAGRGRSYRMTRLNERLRFLKYVGGEYFRPHWDAHYRTKDGGERSFFTIQLYLSGEGCQDREELERAMKKVKDEDEDKDEDKDEDENKTNVDVEGELLGGATAFLPRLEEKERVVRVFPKTGSVLVFQQSELLHSGDPVFRGTKYTVRTDVMYELCEAGA
ncbi:hypothetical protein BJX61DRAFT_125410 [Aspergillus egyptiacus]|nr:hypothetical protein BJX61DRAFT_125410 [Aspergillus egyptiacus]